MPRARIIPWAVRQGDQAYVGSAANVCPDIVHNFAVENTAVRIEERLLQAIHEDAWWRRFHADLRVDHVVIGEGDENVARIGGVVTSVHPNTSKEAAAWVCESENEKCHRCRQGNVDTILDGRENGYKHRGNPNGEFEW